MNISNSQVNRLRHFVRAGLRSLFRPEPQTAVEWADANYYLPKESAYQEGRWETLPFQRAIMNAMGSDYIREVNVVKSARVGYSKMLLGVYAYFIEHKQRNTLIWLPTDGDAENFMKTHVEPTIRDIPSLLALAPWYGKKHRDNTLTMKRFSNGRGFWCLGGKAAKNYREKSVDVAGYDELAAFDEDIEQEGSPTFLGDKRIEGSVWPKSIRGSTPKVRGTCQIERAASESPHFMRFHVACPHCGEEQYLKFGDKETPFGLKWTPDDPSSVFYLCEHNACVIRQQELDFTDARYICEKTGIWTRDGILWFSSSGEEIEPPDSVTFHIWTAYSPFTTWVQIVKDWMKTKGDTRTITSANIDRLRFTFGVQALVETTSKGDRNPSEVRLLVQIQRNGGWVTEKDITIKGKTTSQYLASVVVGNLPPRPFNIRMRRMTPDSTTDQLQNKTLWSSYTEIIDVKQCYPNTALVGVQVDSEQFGSQQVSRNYHLRGRILQVPSNYNPQTRQYSGIWDGTFKPAYSNNMAWCLWDMLTHPRYGMGKRLGAADVDKWALYVIGQNCDQSVPDGFGGTEPRIACNAYLTTQRKAWDVLSDFCSAMRCMPVWNGQTLTFVQDRPSDKVWTYNRSNVVMPDDGAPFRYSFSALKDRHNAVEVNWIDPDNGWETATELVEDTQAIARYGRNVTKMDAFGCTSRGQAHRAGLWLIKTELLETQTVDFSVGAEGLRHVPGDVIEICDDDYAGISTGGRVLAVNSQTRTLTLDREITLPSSGTTLISLVDGSGNPVSVEVQSVTDGVKVKVSRVPDGVAEYSVWGLKLPTLRQRLFRCVSIRENDGGTYAITAVQHVPEKEAIVDNGAHFDGDLSGTVNGVTPPAVQHLTAEVTADSGEYQVLARWDTPKVVKGVSFMLRLTVAADDGSERLVSTARTTETTYRFTQLALGRYTLTVRAVNAWGQQGDPASVSFRIAAPVAPSRIELTPGYFQITATPHLAVYDPTVQFEFWFSEKRITDIRQVETTARYLGTGLYWIAASINIKPGHDYYFYIRSVNTVGKSAFVEAVGRASDDAEGYLDFFKGEIGKTHLAQELWTQIDNGQLAPDLAEIRTSITNVSNEITQTVNKKLEDQSAAIQQIQKVQVDTNNNLNSMWAVKLQQMKDGRLYIAGIGAGIENTPAGMQSQVLLAADRIAMINPANGNTKPMFVGQGDQIFMNDVFLKRLTAPTITSGGNPPAFSLTPDGRLTAKNADISGNVNANSGTLNNVTINENCRVLGKLSANQIEGDLVKTVGKAFPRDSRAPERWPSGTITVRVYDDQPFDRQIVIPAVAFSGAKHERENNDIYSSCRLIVRKNGAEIYNRTALDNTLIYSGVIDMPAGRGHMTLEFSVSSWLVNDWYPTASISDLLVVVMKKATAGISIR
ncbi:phage attachment tail tip protein J [Escherichia coli]